MKTTRWPIVLLVLFGTIIYANTLNVPFHFDDEYNIQHPALRMESLSLEQFKESLADGALRSRPVSNFSFALNYFVGGYRVQGYHLVNIGIHICGGIFLYLLLSLTLNLEVNRRKYPHGVVIALMASLLWLVHPLATQSVTYIVQRMNSMAAMFFVLALLLYAVGRSRQLSSPYGRGLLAHWGWFAGSFFSSLLAIGSKEIAATIPFFIFLYEWYFFQDLRWEWLKKKLVWLGGIFLAFIGIAYGYTSGQIIERVFNSCGGRDFTMIERVLTQFRVVIHYITLVIYPNPNRLALDYDFPVSVSLFSPITTLISLVTIVAVVLLAIIISRRERLISFCILWFFGNLVIESSVICLEMVFEHRTYLPSMFLVFLVVAIAYRIAKRHTAVVSTLLALTTIVCGYWTIERNAVWQTSLALWSDSVAKHPGKARPHSNLGLALVEAGELEQAKEEYMVALKIDQDAHIPHNNLAGLYQREGKLELAEFHYQEAVRLKPDYQTSRMNYGVLLREQGQYVAAANHFRHALEKDPENRLVNKNLGNALLRSGQPEEALPVLEQALVGLPHDTELLLDVGEVKMLLGRFDEALATYQKILEKDRGESSAHYHLALLVKQMGREQEALFHYREADRLMRYPVALKYDLGNLFFRLGELAEAEKTYKEFLEVVPAIVMTCNNLGLVLINQGSVEEAIHFFQTALNISPTFQLAADNLRLAKEQLQQSYEKDGAGEKEVPPPQ